MTERGRAMPAAKSKLTMQKALACSECTTRRRSHTRSIPLP